MGGGRAKRQLLLLPVACAWSSPRAPNKKGKRATVAPDTKLAWTTIAIAIMFQALKMKRFQLEGTYKDHVLLVVEGAGLWQKEMCRSVILVAACLLTSHFLRWPS